MRNSLLLLSLSSLFLFSCADVGFDETPNASSVLSTTPDGDAAGQINQPGDSNNGGGNGGNGGNAGGSNGGPNGGNSVVLPKIQFIGPPCIRGSACSVTFRLTSPQSQNVDFDWRTDDTFYLSPAPAGQVNAQPGVHYISTNGHITFYPGETERTVHVQNINPYSYAVTIGVVMSQCRFGGQAYLCSQFFQ